MAIHGSEMYSAHVCRDDNTGDWSVILVSYSSSDPVWFSRQMVNINHPVEVKFINDYLVI